MVLVHGVLKCMHNPILKYAMLLHFMSARHKLLHSSTPETIPGELSSCFSPALVSHIVSVPPACTQIAALFLNDGHTFPTERAEG